MPTPDCPARWCLASVRNAISRSSAVRRTLSRARSASCRRRAATSMLVRAIDVANPRASSEQAGKPSPAAGRGNGTPKPSRVRGLPEHRLHRLRRSGSERVLPVNRRPNPAGVLWRALLVQPRKAATSCRWRIHFRSPRPESPGSTPACPTGSETSRRPPAPLRRPQRSFPPRSAGRHSGPTTGRLLWSSAAPDRRTAGEHPLRVNGKCQPIDRSGGQNPRWGLQDDRPGFERDPYQFDLET
jgi:hypothetical protein